jgi:hypothetical protein
VDTSNAGANVIIADGTTNNFSGENVYRMLKTKYKDDSQQSGTGVKLQKKMRKLDGAFYSYVSMNISGETKGTGVLNINAGYEGLDSELHLTLNGGNVNIFSQDDGINVNEDGVSVVTVNGGSLHILAGLGSEGDGIDSNGFLVINGGTVISMANPNSDSGLDSDRGSYINVGTVVALGSTMDWADDSNKSGQVTMNLQFSGSQNADEAIIITDTNGKVVFAYDPDKDEVAGSNSRWYQGAVISCENLEVGKSYFVYVGGDVYGTETAGVYDVSTVTGFTSDAKQQSYTGTDVGGPGGPGGMGGGARPDDGTMPDGQFDPGQNGQRPDGEPDNGPGQMGQRPDGQPDNGTDPGQNGQRPEVEPGGTRPDDGQPGGTAQSGQAASIYFTMSDQVNGFSGVTDYDETNTGNTNTATFTDVPADAWYESAVQYVYEKGLMTGTSSTTFSPTRTTTRAMIVTILYRLEGSPAVSGSSAFSDVSAGQYYTDAVTWASANGIVTGYSDGRFNPGSLLTRQQLATILYRYAAYKGYDVTASTDLSAYTDGASVSDYARTAMAWANGNGLINGTTTTTLTPAGSATRAQVAAILMRFCESSLNQ